LNIWPNVDILLVRVVQDGWNVPLIRYRLWTIWNSEHCNLDAKNLARTQALHTAVPNLSKVPVRRRVHAISILLIYAR
jgi:hypothetical protein